MAYPRFGLGVEFVLETDASGVGLGAVLSQEQADGHLHPIAYASRSLDNSERNYGITELETLAVVWAARYFRQYLLGHRTTVFTDHSACVSVLSTARPSGKIARWALTIQELNLTLKHRAGKLNCNADALSRNPVANFEQDCCFCDISCCDDCCCECKPDGDVPHGSDHCCGSSSGEECCEPDIGICRGCGVYNGCSCDTDGCIVSGKSKHCGSCKGLLGDSQYCCSCGRNEDVDELFCGEFVLAVDANDEKNENCVVENDDVLKLCESNNEIHKAQMEDNDLQPIIIYLSHGHIPEDQNLARKIVLESQHYEMIDNILHHEDPNQPGRWCIVVPTKLRSQLLTEAHAGCFGGHLSEKKVYNKIRRNFWWYGLRRDVRKFSRGCLSCVTRRGPGYSHRPPMMPIPVKGPFHRVAVDVLQLPLTTSGNKYVIVFMDYLTKWVEAFPTSDQQATTIANLLIEHIICRHGVPEELLSDRGTNFLSDIILELCSLLGIKKINTSGYHPQTDGLVEKFNSTLQNMIAKSTDPNTMEWDKRLPLLLFAYRSVIQESTKESPFFLVYGRDPRLPTGSLLEQSPITYPVDVEDYRTELLCTLKKTHALALESIRKAQEKQKRFYDRQSTATKFKIGDRVMVYMPSETSGKDRKLARPYHGPYRVISLTQTNAEVKLIERPTEPTIFVALNRLRKCYPEQPNDCWLGKKKTLRKTPRPRSPGTDTSQPPPPQGNLRRGPVTRSMKKVTWKPADVP